MKILFTVKFYRIGVLFKTKNRPLEEVRGRFFATDAREQRTSLGKKEIFYPLFLAFFVTAAGTRTMAVMFFGAAAFQCFGG